MPGLNVRYQPLKSSKVQIKQEIVKNSRLCSISLCLTCTDSLALQHHSVEDEADVLGGLGGAWALFAQQVQDFGGEHRVFAVLDELAQVGQARLFALRVLLNDADDAIHDGPLVLKTTLNQI